MKNNKLLYLSLVLIFVFVSVFTLMARKAKVDSKKVATKFLVAYNSRNYEVAKKYGTTETNKLLDLYKTFESSLPDSVKNEPTPIATIIKVEEDKDKSKVTYTNDNDPRKIQTLNLIFVNDQWLVVMTKENEE